MLIDKTVKTSGWFRPSLTYPGTVEGTIWSPVVSRVQGLYTHTIKVSNWSLVPLPFLKPAWTSGSSQFTYCWSLAWRILSSTLLACEMSTILWLVFWFLAKSWVQWSPNVLQLKQLVLLRINAAPAKYTMEYIWGIPIQLYNDSWL